MPDISVTLESVGGGVRRGYVDVGGGQIHYAETRTRPSDLPIVLLHQSASSWLGYADLIEELRNSHWVLALDTPGFGNSDALEGTVTIEKLGASLSSALAQLEIEDYYLFGHHTGASIAASMAASHPSQVRKLILSGPPVLDESQRKRLARVDLDPRPEADGSHLLRHWQRHLRLAQGNLNVAQREVNLFFLSRQPALTYEAVMQADIESWLSAIDCPTLVIGGSEDSIRSGFETAVALLRHATYELIPDQGIYITDEVPDVVADKIGRFFVG